MLERSWLWLAFFALSSIPAVETTASVDRAKIVTERALSAEEPATALTEEGDLSDAGLVQALAQGLDAIRAKHGPVKTSAYSAGLVEAARRSKDQAVLALTLAQHATVLELASRYPEAVAALEEAATLYDALRRPGDAALAQTNIGNLFELQGKLAAAQERYEASRQKGWDHWTARQRTQFLLKQGTLARVLGRPQDAIRIQEEALAIARASSDTGSEARILNNLSLIHTNIAEYRKAIGFAQESLQLREKENHQGRAISLTNLGMIHEAQGDKEEAIRTYRAAAEEAAKSKEPKGVAITAVNLGIQLRKMQRPEEAKRYLEEGLHIADETNFARLRVAARRELGLVSAALKQEEECVPLLQAALAEAEKIGATADLAETQLAIALHAAEGRKPAAERALQLARDAQQPEFEWAALTLLGDLEVAAGAQASAIERYTDAVRVIERLRRRITGSEIQQQTFFEDKLQPYHKLVELHFARGDLDQTFRWIQQAKARVLLDALALERRQLATELPPDQAGELEAARLKVAEADASKNPAAMEPARAELDRLAREVAAPELLAPVIDAQKVATELLDPETALLEYFVLPSRAFLCMVTLEADKAALQILPIELSAEELRKQVEDLRSALASRRMSYEPIAQALWNRILAPAESRLEGRSRLILAPSGPLWQLPFQVLRDQKQRFAIDRWTLSYAPSASSFAQMKERARKRDIRSALVMSNPANLGPDFPDLPGADQLATELSGVYGKKETVVLNGPAATEHAVKERASDFGIMHWAVHGVFDPEAPLESHLRLGGGEGEDGLLKAREIMEMKFRASLAMLAACETARGRGDTGEGVIGMSWAFFLAGCPTVVASQWKVDAASTAELSRTFHRKLAGGASAGQSLRAATLELKANRAYRHPFYWAPFVVIGAGM
ncbi:MAG: CHAT domain-containing protein [Chthoniobacterales bacterium]